MGKVARKFRIKSKQNGLRRAIAVLGRDNDGDFIFINIKTRSFLDATYQKLLAEIKSEYDLPKREKPVNQLSAIEKEVFNLREEKDRISRLILTYDTENVKFKQIENEIKKMNAIAQIISYFDMDAIIEDEDGNEITHWERFEITKGDYFSLCKFLISEEGMCLSEANINIITSELNKLAAGEKTSGEKLLDEQEKIEDAKKEIEEIEGASNEEPNKSE